MTPPNIVFFLPYFITLFVYCIINWGCTIPRHNLYLNTGHTAEGQPIHLPFKRYSKLFHPQTHYIILGFPDLWLEGEEGIFHSHGSSHPVKAHVTIILPLWHTLVPKGKITFQWSLAKFSIAPRVTYMDAEAKVRGSTPLCGLLGKEPACVTLGQLHSHRTPQKKGRLFLSTSFL